jgi:hypothetical protein
LPNGDDSNQQNEAGSNNQFKKPVKKTVKHAVKAAVKQGANGANSAQNTAFLQKRGEFESPYRHYKLETTLRACASQDVPNGTIEGGKKVAGVGGGGKITQFARSSTVSASFGYNLYNMPVIKNLQIEDYNLLNIRHTKERPYFFGLGIPTRFNCNHGFQKKVKSSRLHAIESLDDFENRNINVKSGAGHGQEHGGVTSFKSHKNKHLENKLGGSGGSKGIKASQIALGLSSGNHQLEKQVLKQTDKLNHESS